MAELSNAGLTAGNQAAENFGDHYTCRYKNRLAEFLAVFVKIDFIPPLLARLILSKVNITTTQS